MKKVLITGGAGFVGRHMVRRFLERGDEVHCVDNIAPFTGGIHPSKGWPLFDPREHRSFKFYQEDCRTFFKKNPEMHFDYAFHLAAMVGGRLMIENNPLAVADDLSIDSEFWQWAAKAQPTKSICFSSSAAYPIKFQREQGYVLLKEDMINLNGDLGLPDMSYGWAKLTHEYLAKLAYERHGLKSVVYRPFSGYGEDQDDSYPFPSICKRVLTEKNKEIVTVWGTGRQMRDFVHIEDCVDAVFMTMDKIDNADALNLSTGLFTSFISFAETAARLCGYTPSVKGTSDKPEGVFARAGDVSKQKSFSIQHRIKFEDGIKRAIEYFEKNLNQTGRYASSLASVKQS